MTEATSSKIIITDCPAICFGEFLTFLYTDSCDQSPLVAEQLFVLSQKYQVTGLQALTVKHLASTLTVNNCYLRRCLHMHLSEEWRWSLWEIIFRPFCNFNLTSSTKWATRRARKLWSWWQWANEQSTSCWVDCWLLLSGKVLGMSWWCQCNEWFEWFSLMKHKQSCWSE